MPTSSDPDVKIVHGLGRCLSVLVRCIWWIRASEQLTERAAFDKMHDIWPNVRIFGEMHCAFDQFWTTTFKPAVVEEMHNSFGHWLHIWPNVQIKMSVFVLIFRSRYFCKSHTYSLLLIRKESLQTTHRLFVVTAQQHQRSFSMSSVIGGKWKSFFLPLPKTLFLQRFVCWLVDLSVYWVSICLHCI